ncbi:unnamed protein product [Enterobius vermicularis]|uniref:Filamin-A n=1 Tax=Enterobius vermicularis TaxID=51028 RepID=A0A0N4VGW7_ENTVE|nr:unnamed protein product [Enterobius vermicularis]
MHSYTINAHGDSTLGSVRVEAVSPSGREWQIGILYDNEHIRGSPFACHVYDANLVQVYGLDVGLVGQQLKFSVNSSQAGEGAVKVSVVRLGRTIPCEVVEQASSGVHRVSFTPDGAGQYKIHVLFNNIEVKGSPFILDIADASSVSVFGENLRMASVDRLSVFMIHAVGAECKDITVTVTAPSGKQKRASVFPIDDNTFKVEWKAVEAGEHLVDVRLFDQSVYESPFICNVGDPDLVTVRDMPQYLSYDSLNREHSFEIDASAAGSGNLEIMINGGRIPCRVRGLGGRKYLAMFIPTQPLPHIVEMSFNNEHVRMSPWSIPFVPEQHRNIYYHNSEQVSRAPDIRMLDKRKPWYTELTGLGLQRGAVNKISSFEITGEGLEPGAVVTKLYDPKGREVPIRCYQSGNKLICEYVLKQVGEHRLEAIICGKKIDPYPLMVSAYSADKVRIEPLRGSTPGQPVQFVGR